MRIISKVKDYYDIGLTYGIDPNVVWVREPAEIELDTLKYFATSGKYLNYHLDTWYMTDGHRSDLFRAGIVFFCGKSYPYVVKVDPVYYKPQHIYFYSIEDYITYCNSQGYLNKEQARKARVHRFWDTVGNKTVRKFFDSASNIPKEEIIEIHRRANSPIIDATARDRTTPKATKDANLEKRHFACVVDPWTAFQELSMFIPAYLNTTVKETVDVSDDTRIAKHGFNEKSFRHPTNSRKKKDV